MRDIDLIVVHCADTPPSMDIGAEEIRKWHVDERGWSDVGYHYVIRRSGKVELGRPINRPGAHVRGHNGTSIGICLIGGMRQDRSGPEFNFTRAQMFRLDRMVAELRDDLDIDCVLGHRDLDSGKTCPNFNVKEFFNAKSA